MNLEFPLNTHKFRTMKTLAFIRHADRDPIPDEIDHKTIGLNRQGRARAFSYGNRLRSFTGLRILTSPILRCKETTQEITKGYGAQVTIEESFILGDPGAFVVDRVAAREHFKRYSGPEVLVEMVNGKPMEGILDLDQGCDIIKYSIRNVLTLTPSECHVLMITHDFFVAAMVYHHFGLLLTQEHWPDFLEGIEFTSDGNELHGSWRGLQRVDSQIGTKQEQ